jgi:predicted anti-sigma-YlaC factor YlaD
MNAPRQPGTPLTCDEFDALLGDLLDGDLDSSAQGAANAHSAQCARCRGLVTDLSEIRDDAARLPVLGPSRDLWEGISARIETPAIGIAGAASRRGRLTMTQFAAAASILVAVTAGVTWTVANRDATEQTTIAAPFALEPASDSGTTLVQGAATSGETTAFRVAAAYDHEIAALRATLASRPRALDSATARVLATNLRIIDDAIARVRVALDSLPSNAMLSQQLARAYDMKLNTLRQIAAIASE